MKNKIEKFVKKHERTIEQIFFYSTGLFIGWKLGEWYLYYTMNKSIKGINVTVGDNDVEPIYLGTNVELSDLWGYLMNNNQIDIWRD